jgi:hypothetical protein
MAKAPRSDPFAPSVKSDMHLERRPEYAKALGELCADWAMMELKLFGVFASLTGPDGRAATDVTHHILFPSHDPRAMRHGHGTRERSSWESRGTRY